MKECSHPSPKLSVVNGDGTLAWWTCPSCQKTWKTNPQKDLTEEISDGYHTFGELYEHRHALCLALMRSLPRLSWFSKRHEDGKLCFGDENWFIVGVNLPTGMITYHLPSRLWEIAQATGAQELPRGERWDGHTPEDVVQRLKDFAQAKRLEFTQTPLDPDFRSALTPEALWDLYDEICNEVTKVEDNND